MARILQEESVHIDIDKIRSTLLTKYPNLKLLLKLGSHGCAILTSKLYINTPSVTIHNSKIMEDYKIIDTTGAGKFNL